MPHAEHALAHATGAALLAAKAPAALAAARSALGASLALIATRFGYLDNVWEVPLREALENGEFPPGPEKPSLPCLYERFAGAVVDPADLIGNEQCRLFLNSTAILSLTSEPIVFVSMSSIRNWYQT